jgi:hypothetical protein
MKNKYNPVSGEFDLVNSLQDISYTHTQSVPATTWVVNHNLNTKCSVQVVDEDKNEIIAQIDWIDNNTVNITLNIPFTGYVYCN